MPFVRSSNISYEDFEELLRGVSQNTACWRGKSGSKVWADAAPICASSRRRPGTARRGSRDDYHCEVRVFDRQPPPDWGSLVEGVVRKVKHAVQEVAGEFYDMLSEALEPPLAYGQWQAVRAAVESFPNAQAGYELVAPTLWYSRTRQQWQHHECEFGQELNYIEIGSNWGTSMALMGELILGAGKQPGKMLSIDPYDQDAGSRRMQGVKDMIYRGWAADVRERLRGMPESLVSPLEQASLDNYTKGSTSAMTPHMVGARVLYRKLRLEVQHIRKTSRAAGITLLSPAMRGLGPPLFHIAYIDGCHTEQCVMGDTAVVMALLEPGGIVVFDDVQHPFAVPVNKALYRTFTPGLIHETWKSSIWRFCSR